MKKGVGKFVPPVGANWTEHFEGLLKQERERVLKEVEILASEFGMDDVDCERLLAHIRSRN